MEQINGCWNCEHSRTSCGMLLCDDREGYVMPSGKCSWWVKKTKEKKPACSYDWQ